MGDNGFHSIFFVLRLLCLFVAINCRFQDKYLLGGAMSCSGNLARAFSPHFVFQFVTWGVCMLTVAQIFNLPYRRFVIGRASDRSHAPWFPDVWQSATLRYSRLQVCATGIGDTVNRYWGAIRALPGRCPGVAPGWFEDAPLALTVVARASRLPAVGPAQAGPCVGCTIRTGGTCPPSDRRDACATTRSAFAWFPARLLFANIKAFAWLINGLMN
jgi:hypothetical protein